MQFPTHIVATGGIIENDDKGILLVKSFHHGWEFPGGQVENKESLTQAVMREIMEESNVTVHVGKLIGIYSNIQEYTAYDGKTSVPTKVMVDFVCQYVKGKFRPSNETSQGMWITKDKVLDYIRHPAYIYRYKNYLKHAMWSVYAVYQSKPFHVISEIEV